MCPPSRLHLLRSARRVCGVSIAWAVAVGTSAVIAGTATRSIARLGFGLETGVDGFASAVLLWRFRGADGADAPSGRRHAREHSARPILGVVLLVVAAYVGAEAIHAILEARAPARSAASVVLAGASIAVLPLLSVVKLRLARRLESGALRADAVLSAAGGALAAAVLIGLVLSDIVAWGWADPAAATCIAVAMGAEGARALLGGGSSWRQR